MVCVINASRLTGIGRLTYDRLHLYIVHPQSNRVAFSSGGNWVDIVTVPSLRSAQRVVVMLHAPRSASPAPSAPPCMCYTPVAPKQGYSMNSTTILWLFYEHYIHILFIEFIFYSYSIHWIHFLFIFFSYSIHILFIFYEYGYSMNSTTFLQTIPWDVTLIRWYIYLGLYTLEVGCPSDNY